MKILFPTLVIASLAAMSNISSSQLYSQETVVAPAGAAASTDSQATPGRTSPFTQLVWQDEFDGEMLDYSKWGVEVNAFGGGNSELQIYTDRSENVRVEDGCLVLEARKDNAAVSGTAREYSSGRVRTKNRGDWKYGRIEIRAQLPSGAGLWPAIWMLPTEDRYGGWAASGEIDIMEMRGQEPNIVLGTLHYGATWPNNKFSGDQFTLPEGSFADDFHVFTVDWREGEIQWLIDGQHYQTQTEWTTEGHEFPAPFDQKFHLLINLAVGGHFLGPPNDSTPFPAKMLVDYVRVYQ
ncbi:glycoside hydrolase family 16 protein [Aporhodopirellula aestuarii]|uniref:Glycoside hydrolase family 16 protein n=1 Tax=Aporhodopirellula aestuarii TaxID=2950107 RepID=A0ABT0U3U5_9BACT|nr:glycoside hydrolase family 16 protein [Aporhodopirellula aestuarii]MCM2371584.1 glycoside hydrolase family 16 protein [Aporhodopirellula aestuarii]